MAKVLVTGGAGFIGSHVIDILNREGHEVAVADSLVTGKRENVNPLFKFWELDIQSEELRLVFEEFSPHYVIHLAAQNSVSKSIGSPKKDAEVNIAGLLNVLELCKDYKVKKIIFTSSAAIYGDSNTSPILEEQRLEPLSPYGLSKFTGENYIKLFDSLYGLPFSIMRLANVYGPRQKVTGETGVIPCFTNQMIEGITPIIEGDGNQRRDFIYVTDVAEAVLETMKSSESHLLNISSEKSRSINEVYKILAELTNHKAQARKSSPRKGDIYESCLSNAKAKSVLNWEPIVTIEEGLNKTVNYFKEKRVYS